MRLVELSYSKDISQLYMSSCFRVPQIETMKIWSLFYQVMIKPKLFTNKHGTYTFY